MKKIAATMFCLLAVTARADLSELTGKMKEGLYETTVSMSISGIEQVPQGVQMAPHTTSKCFTKEDVAKGSQVLNPQNLRSAGNSDCQIQNFIMSGNSATYSISCPSQTINLDGSITFTGNGFKGVNSGAMDQGGRPVKLTLNFESKYVGACNK
jgi:hypothetical protein